MPSEAPRAAGGSGLVQLPTPQPPSGLSPNSFMKRVARSPCRAEPLTATTRSGIGHHAGRADRRGQRFGQRLKAYVVGANGPPVSEKELKQLVRTKLAPFKIPREIEFVNELPHTETGKVAKAMLGDPGRASYLGNWEDDVR